MRVTSRTNFVHLIYQWARKLFSKDTELANAKKKKYTDWADMVKKLMGHLLKVVKLWAYEQPEQKSARSELKSS